MPSNILTIKAQLHKPNGDIEHFLGSFTAEEYFDNKIKVAASGSEVVDLSALTPTAFFLKSDNDVTFQIEDGGTAIPLSQSTFAIIPGTASYLKITNAGSSVATVVLYISSE